MGSVTTVSATENMTSCTKHMGGKRHSCFLKMCFALAPTQKKGTSSDNINIIANDCRLFQLPSLCKQCNLILKCNVTLSTNAHVNAIWDYANEENEASRIKRKHFSITAADILSQVCYLISLLCA